MNKVLRLCESGGGFEEYKSGSGLFTLTYAETDAQFLCLRIGDE